MWSKIWRQLYECWYGIPSKALSISEILAVLQTKRFKVKKEKSCNLPLFMTSESRWCLVHRGLNIIYHNGYIKPNSGINISRLESLRIFDHHQEGRFQLTFHDGCVPSSSELDESLVAECMANKFSEAEVLQFYDILSLVREKVGVE